LPNVFQKRFDSAARKKISNCISRKEISWSLDLFSPFLQ
jgi:hypothetical protein